MQGHFFIRRFAFLRTMQELPTASRPFDAKGLYVTYVLQGDITSAAVWSTKGDIAGISALELNFALYLTGRREFGYGALAVARDVDIAIYITAHALHIKVGKLDEQALVGYFACGR